MNEDKDYYAIVMFGSSLTFTIVIIVACATKILELW
jgi:hypothetical protein